MLNGIRVSLLFASAIGLALLFSALLNAPLYEAFPDISSRGQHKLLNNIGKLFLIPFFIALLFWYGLYSKQALGYNISRRAFAGELVKGLLMGVAILSLLNASLLLLEIRVFKPVNDGYFAVLLKALIAGLLGGIVIGFVEETFFRGGLFGALRKRAGFFATMLLSSLLYASMHFIDPQPLGDAANSSWYSGLYILQNSFAQFADIATLDSFAGLFAVGVYLAIVRERTGNLAYVVGLHAGFVFVIKVMKKITSVDSTEPLNFLVGNYDGMVGYLSATGLLIHATVTWFFWRKNWRKSWRKS